MRKAWECGYRPHGEKPVGAAPPTGPSGLSPAAKSKRSTADQEAFARLLDRAQLGDAARELLWKLQTAGEAGECPECGAGIASGDGHNFGCQLARYMLTPPYVSDEERREMNLSPMSATERLLWTLEERKARAAGPAGEEGQG